MLGDTSSDSRLHEVYWNSHPKYTIYKYKTMVLTPNSEITLGSLFWTWSYKCLGLVAKKGLIQQLMRYANTRIIVASCFYPCLRHVALLLIVDRQ
jgi:hypothetical protein